MELAVKNDPFAPRLRFILANSLIADHRFDEAAAYCLTLPDDFSGKIEWLGRARLGQGRIQEAIAIFQSGLSREGDIQINVQGFLGFAYGRAGRREEAEQLAAAAQEPYVQALTFAGLGDKERTLQALEHMAVLGPVRLGRNLNYPEFDLVRSDPRLKALREKMGLPE